MNTTFVPHGGSCVSPKIGSSCIIRASEFAGGGPVRTAQGTVPYQHRGLRLRVRVVNAEKRWRPDWTAVAGADADADQRGRHQYRRQHTTILFELRARNPNGPGPATSVTATGTPAPQTRPRVRVTVKLDDGGARRHGVADGDGPANPDGGPVTYLREAPSESFDAKDRASVTWTARFRRRPGADPPDGDRRRGRDDERHGDDHRRASAASTPAGGDPAAHGERDGGRAHGRARRRRAVDGDGERPRRRRADLRLERAARHLRRDRPRGRLVDGAPGAGSRGDSGLGDRRRERHGVGRR